MKKLTLLSVTHFCVDMACAALFFGRLRLDAGWWLWMVRRHLKGPVTLSPTSQPTGTIATYFPNIDAKLAGEGIFRSRYWESLHDALAEEAGAGQPPAVRWLFVHFPSPQGSLAQCRQWIDGFQRARKSGVSFNYLEEFLSAGDMLQGWLRYARLALASLVAERAQACG